MRGGVSVKKFDYIKWLTLSLRKHSGRNNKGRITVRHRGGGLRRRYRIIDYFFSNKMPAVFIRYENDVSRNVLLCLVCFLNGLLAYRPVVMNMDVSGVFSSDERAPVIFGNFVKLSRIPLGFEVSYIQMMDQGCVKLVRSGGLSAVVVRKTLSHVFLRMPSGLVISLSSRCKALIGVLVINLGRRGCKLKAGFSRSLGLRPVVRGVAMNPIDHPHGGGEGKTSGGRSSVSPCGCFDEGL